MALQRSDLSFRWPPATGLLGHYPGRTLTGKSIAACRTHSDSRSCTGCPADRTRSPRSCSHPHPRRPGWPSPADRRPTPPTSRSQTAFLTASAGPCSSSRAPRLTRRTQPRTTRPLRFTPTAPGRSFPATTGRSASASRDGTQSLTGSARLGHSLSPSPPGRQYRDAPSHVPRESPDQAHVAYMPDTAWPISGHPPDSSRAKSKHPVLMSPLRYDTSSAIPSPGLRTVFLVLT